MEEGKALAWNDNYDDDDGGSFERIMREVEDAANGDESLKINLLKRINVLVEKELAKEIDDLGFYIPKRRRGSVFENMPRRFDLNQQSGEEEEVMRKPKRKRGCGSVFDNIPTNMPLPLRRYDDEEEEEVMRKPNKQKKKKKGNKNVKVVEEVVADMPDAFKTRVQDENGTDLVLVIQKQLTPSDLNQNKNRLAIPPSKMRDDRFLNQQVKRILEASSEVGIEVLMIPPSLKQNVPLKLKRWKMDPNYTYNLIEKWYRLVVSDKDNGLEENVTVQLWSFRKNSSALCFALVKC